MSLKNLEEELGVEIFERKKGVLELTYAGELFCHWAEDSLRSKQILSDQLSDISSNARHKIRLGISPHRSELHHMAVHGRIEHWPHKAFELRHLFKSVVQLQRPDFDDLRIEAEWLGDGLLPRHGLIPLQIQHDIGKLLHTLSPVLVAVLFGCRLFQNLLLSI